MEKQPKILVFLQNAWGVEDGYIPSYDRESFVKSQAGRRLKEMLPDLSKCDLQIRNANKAVGKVSSSNFPPDEKYIFEQITEIKPDLILACGVNARKGVIQTCTAHNIMPKFLILTPHPAYRALSKQSTSLVKAQIERKLKIK